MRHTGTISNWLVLHMCRTQSRGLSQTRSRLKSQTESGIQIQIRGQIQALTQTQLPRSIQIRLAIRPQTFLRVLLSHAHAIRWTWAS